MQQILILLLKQEGPVPLKNLAEELGISRRTVQRELESIDRPLARWGMLFRSKVGSGIWLEGSPEDKAILLNALEENDQVDTTDKQERRKRLVLEILKDKTVKKLYYYKNCGVREYWIVDPIRETVMVNWFEDETKNMLYGFHDEIEFYLFPGLKVKMLDD